MIIECPYCSTRFRLNERSLGARRPTLRCSNCKRTFPLPARPEPEEELSFEYDDGADLESSAEGEEYEAEDDDEDDEPVAPQPSPRSEQFPLPIGDDEPQPSLFGGDDRHHIDDDEYSIEEPDTLSVDDDDGDDYVVDEPDIDDGSETHPVRLKSLLAVIALVVGGYALLALTLRSEPQWARSLLQQVPLLGSEINAIELGREIVLDGLDGRYEQTKEGKTIFLITGSARNEHDQAVRGIRVEFELLGASGAPLAKQSTTCGNAMRPDLVRDLTEEQVRILRGWGTKPPEETTVRPGDSCPIVSIFMDVTEGVTTFSGEVVQARRLS